MNEIINKILSKIRKQSKVIKVLKKALFLAATFTVLSIILEDLHAHEGGYLKSISRFILSLLEIGSDHLIEIANTPLASLTIVNIVVFLIYIFVAINIFKGACGVFLWLIEKQLSGWGSESYHENKFLHSEPDEECAAYIYNMRKAESVSDLDSMLGYAIGKWPQWEKQLSRGYKLKKRLLEENN